MPASEKTAVAITCDNPNCPGNSLKKNDWEGWLRVTTEVYGDPPQQHVYCSATCAGADAPASFETPEELKPQAPPEATQ